MKQLWGMLIVLAAAITITVIIGAVLRSHPAKHSNCPAGYVLVVSAGGTFCGLKPGDY